MTKPSRSASKGREAVAGSSLRVERARIALNPAIPMAVMLASLPPAIIARAQPRRMVSAASPIAWAELAQAEVVQKLGPRAPVVMETWPAARLVIMAGMRKGLIRPGPRLRRRSNCSERVAIPPIPLAMKTPTSSRLVVSITRPELRNASVAAATANCTKRSVRRASLRSITRVGSKPLTSAAKWVS